MKKSLGLFFFGIFTIATGLGCLSACSKQNNANGGDKKDKKISYVELDENETFRLGSYPQNIADSIDPSAIKNNGTEKQTSYGTKYYEYQNKKYAIIDEAVVDAEGSANRYLSNGSPVDNWATSHEVVIEFVDIEWQLLKTSSTDDVAYLISTNVLDREVFNTTSGTHLSYYDSSLFTYLNTNFKEMAFLDEDYRYLAYSEGGKGKVQIDIPTKEDVGLDTYQDKNLKQASDYAILKNLTSHSAWNHGTGVPYLNAGYWVNDYSDDYDRIEVCWAKVAFSACLMDDPKIGVRPVIAVNYKQAKGGGSDGEAAPTPAKPSSSNGNVTLGFGIAFMVVGMGGLIAFFIIWGKKHPTGKPPIWIIISLGCCLVITVTGLGCFAGGLRGGSGVGCFKVGYYVQVGQYSGNGVVQVGYTAWLIRADGTASYCSHLKDNTAASDFAPDNYMTGTYKISGSKLVIDIPKREIQNFGPVGGTFTYTIKDCGTFKNSVDTYQWVRGE